MKKYIVCKIQPFVFKQTIQICEGQNCINEYKSRLTDLKDNLFSLCKTNNIHDIILDGSRTFAYPIRDAFISPKYSNEHLIKVYLEGDNTSEIFN